MSEFVCCECGVKRGSKDAMKSHICAQHLRWTPFECSYCSANHRSTWEATEHDLTVHINEAHPGQDVKILFIPDNHKRQLLKDKMRQTTRSAANRPLVVAPTVPEVAAERMKTEVITIEDDEDYKPPSSPALVDSSGDVDASDAQSTNHITHSSSQALSVGEVNGHQPVPNLTTRAGTETTGVESENNQLIESRPDWRNIDPHESDDDDFKPYESDGDDFSPCPTPPPAGAKSEVADDDDFKPDTGDSQIQQPEAGHSSGAPGGSKRGRSKPKVKGKGAKAVKPKQQTSGYCLSCERRYESMDSHLQAKLSSPVYECSQCTYKTERRSFIQNHIKTQRCRGAKVVRIRSKHDVSAEMQQLKEAHFGVVPREKRFRCIKCSNKGICNVSHHIFRHHFKMGRYECPVCGWSSDRSAVGVKAHMKQKHRSCHTLPISNVVKYRDRIREIQKAVIVRNT